MTPLTYSVVVKNGQANRVVFTITTPRGTDRALAIESVTGAFLDPARPEGHKRHVLRNMTTTKLRDVTVHQPNGQPLQLPYNFFSEFKPQKLDVEFRASVIDQSSSAKYNMQLYRGSVVVEEPKQSLFDLQLLSVYAIMLAFTGGVAYMLYQMYLEPLVRSKAAKRKEAKHATPKVPVTAATGKNGKSYDEDWIPEQSSSRNLRPRKQRGGRK